MNRVMTCAFPGFIVLMSLVYTGATGQMKADKTLSEEAADATSDKFSNTPSLEENNSLPENLMSVMQEFRIAAEIARKHAREGVIPKEEVEREYAMMAQMLETILEHMYSATNAEGFLRAKGLDTVITPNLHIDHPPLRLPLLRIIEVLFEVAPITTRKIIHISILDRLVEIFERDDDVLMKNRAINILSVWLPGNPRAQIRVLKMKGFDPFYRQLTKLESSITKKTFTLFNSLIREHMKAREMKIENKISPQLFQMYQQIGLIERLSTPKMCNGLFKIFRDIFSLDFEMDVVPPLLNLLVTIKPHCYKIFYNNPQVESFLDEVLNYLKDPANRKILLEDGLFLSLNELTANMMDFAQLVKKKEHSEL